MGFKLLTEEELALSAAFGVPGLCDRKLSDKPVRSREGMTQRMRPWLEWQTPISRMSRPSGNQGTGSAAAALSGLEGSRGNRFPGADAARLHAVAPCGAETPARLAQFFGEAGSRTAEKPNRDIRDNKDAKDKRNSVSAAFFPSLLSLVRVLLGFCRAGS